jgi:NAD(P)-dependent dehydrogenase (short-subunit alcohol dehydrogenase family)
MQNQKVCLITGATGGIGWETAKQLAERSLALVLVGRDAGRTTAAVDKIKAQTGNLQVEYLLADLAVQSEVRRLAGEVNERFPQVNVLLNNVGAMFWSRAETADGIEYTIALNYLNVFLLTQLLLDQLKANAPSRIIIVSSDAHQGSRLDLTDLQGKRSYSGMGAYGRSKLAELLYTYELARRLAGTGVTVNALHPGFVASNFGKNNGWLFRLVMPLAHRFALPVERGAQTSVYLASSPEVEGVSGKYFVSCRAIPSSKESYDAETGRQLWDLSCRLTGIAEPGP